ncbi:MAG TPA: serine hydrolase, partial [Terriglobales bacterium]|nr:serine hydrolase [Terriglobales bacterium]
MLSAKHLRILCCLFLPSWVCLAQAPDTGVSPDVRIDRIMQTHYAAGDFNGTVLVARSGKILYQHAFGLANREWDVPNDLETKFDIGSMTK